MKSKIWIIFTILNLLLLVKVNPVFALLDWCEDGWKTDYIVGKHGDPSPKNDYHLCHNIYDTEGSVIPESILGIGADKKTASTAKNIFVLSNDFKKMTITTSSIRNIGDWIPAKAKLGDHAAMASTTPEAQKAEKADSAIKSTTALYATRALEVDSALKADNGLAETAPEGSMYIASDEAWMLWVPLELPKPDAGLTVLVSDETNTVKWSTVDAAFRKVTKPLLDACTQMKVEIARYAEKANSLVNGLFLALVGAVFFFSALILLLWAIFGEFHMAGLRKLPKINTGNQNKRG
jgi:hypothetical protein